MSISEKAIEAAARAICEVRSREYDREHPEAARYRSFSENDKRMARAALEAALPLHEDGGRDELLALAKFILGGIQRKKLMDQTILRRNGEEIETEALSTKIAGVIARAEAAAPPAPMQEDDQLSALWIAETRENERLRAAMQEACDLLAERKHGSPARSPGHNARLALESALAAAPPAPALHQHAQPAGREALMHAAKSAVEQWADWCHNNEAQWSGWGDMVVPEGATMWTADAERVLAAFAPPAPVQEDLDRREIACLRAAVTDAGAYIALCPPPPEATGSLRIELLERRERIGKAAALIADKDPQP